MLDPCVRQLTFYFKGLMATVWTGGSGAFKLIPQIGASTSTITGISDQSQHHPHATTEKNRKGWTGGPRTPPS